MFNDFLDTFNLKNHVSFHTHTSKHHLHLCITDNTMNLVNRVTQGYALSDHNFIQVSLEILKPIPPMVTTTYRKLAKINHDQFKEDIWQDLQMVQDMPDLEGKIEKYNIVCATVLEEHALLVTKMSRKCHNPPWFNDQIRHEIQIHRKKETMLFRDTNDCNYWSFY